jgi:hypothetical protein
MGLFAKKVVGPGFIFKANLQNYFLRISVSGVTLYSAFIRHEQHVLFCEHTLHAGKIIAFMEGN